MLKLLWRRRFIVLLILAAVIGIWLYAANSRTSSNGQKTHTVRRRDLVQSITLPGAIAAREAVNLRFQSSGRLAWVGVKEGDAVKKYQALASLDQRDLKNRLNKYLNSFVKTRYDFDQTKEDEHETSVTGLTREIRDEAKRIMEKAQFDLNSSVLDVELQSLAIEYATLATPISGIVTNIDKKFAGENITPTTAEIEVINPDSLYFAVSADQSEVIDLTEGMTAGITFDPFDDMSVTGSVRSIAFVPTAGESSTVYKVELDMTPEASGSAKFRIGMTGDASFTIRKKENTLSLPTQAISQDNGKKYVFKKDGTGRVRTEITVGDEFDEYTEITGGLAEGDIVYD